MSGRGAAAVGGTGALPVTSGMSAGPPCGATDVLDSFPPSGTVPQAGAPDGAGPAGMTQASAGSAFVKGVLT